MPAADPPADDPPADDGTDDAAPRTIVTDPIGPRLPEPGDRHFVGPVRLVSWFPEQEGWWSYPYLKLPIPFGLFLRLPRHPAYKWEYYGGRAVLTPRPKAMHAVRPTRGVDVPEDLRDPETFRGDVPTVRPLIDADWPALARPMDAAFAGVTPFSQMDDGRAENAVRECLDKTRAGGDGPLIGEACVVAEAPGNGDRSDEDRSDEERGPHVIGAALVTLYRPGDPADWGSVRPAKDPPVNWKETAWGAPHLTWAFVAGWHARNGVGTALLSAACAALAELGYEELLSTFARGNDASAYWHWRNGFRLMPGPFSQRSWRHAAKAGRAAKSGDGGG